MNEWIKCSDRLPDIGEELLLFINQYRSDSGSFWSNHIIRGFYSDEYEDDKPGFFADNFTVISLALPENPLDGTHEYCFLSDCKYIEITHWMNIPSHPETNELCPQKK